MTISGAPMDVAFGANGRFAFLYSETGPLTCSIDTLGRDPAPYIHKYCSTRVHASTTMNLLINGDFRRSDEHECVLILGAARADRQFRQAISTGKVTFKVSGYFGGYRTEGDTAAVMQVWWEQLINRTPVQIGNVSAADRHNQTGLLYRSATGPVPPGVAYADVDIEFIRSNGTYNDGYADSVSLTLSGV